jgi:hypothetical protein
MQTPQREVGYQGKVTLVSPRGDQQIIMKIPGRRRKKTDWDRNVSTVNGSGLITCSSYYGGVSEDDLARDRRFRRLLSRGWRVTICGRLPRVSKPDVKLKKGLPFGDEFGDDQEKAGDTTEQKQGRDAGTSPNAKTEQKVKGEKESTQGKKPQQKQAEKGQLQQRGNRGGRKKTKGKQGDGQKRRGRSAKLLLTVQKCNQTGGAVRAPQPLQVTRELLKSAEASAELLAELVGRSALKVQYSVTVNAEALLTALEIGDNPLPPLESPDERPKVRILVSPDCSGSTQSWNGLGQAWALHLSSFPDVDVSYVDNFNGEFDLWTRVGDAYVQSQTTEQVKELLGKMDIILYLGDGDGRKLCSDYARGGVTVLAFDTYCANAEKPRLKIEELGHGGHLYWVDRVSVKAPETWAQAIRLCLNTRG